MELGILDGIDIEQNKQVVYNEALLQNRGTVAFQAGNCEQKAFVNALYDAAEPIDYSGATVQEKLSAQMLMDDQEAFLQTLIDSDMTAAAMVYAKARGLPTDGINFDQKEMKKPISEGKVLKIGSRTKKIFDWPLKKVDEIVLEPLNDDEQDDGAAKIDTKKWDDDQESSSETEEQIEDKKQQWSDDESDSDEDKEFMGGDAKPKIPDVLNPQCQAMKELGLSKDSEKLQSLIAEVKDSVTETGALPFTPSSLDKKLRKAGDAFSAGDFELSYQLFDEVYQKYKLLVVQGTVTSRQMGQMFVRIQNYLRALKAELLRR